MLELSDKYLKRTIKNILQWATKNIFETNEKIRKPHQRNRYIRIKWKFQNWKVQEPKWKGQWMDSRAEWKGQRKEQLPLKSLSEQRRSNKWNINENNLKDLGDYTKTSNIRVIGVLEGGVKEGWKNTQRNNGWKHPNFDKRYKPTDLGHWMSPEEIHAKAPQN